MSLKSVEMQFVLHKNDEVGLKQNQMTHKPQHDQAVLGDASVKQTEKDRQVSAKLSETSGGVIHEGAPHHGAGGNASGKKRSKADDEQKAKEKAKGTHPYKGHHIDLSL